MVGLKPWEEDSVEPRLALPIPGFEAAVGDAVALPSAPVAVVADATVAPVGAASASMVARQPSEGDSPEAVPAVAPAQAVAVAAPSTPAPTPDSGTGDEAPSGGASPVVAPTEGPSSPVATPPETGGGSPGRPIPSGGPIIESCDGDEYVITIVIDPESAGEEEAQVEIVLKRFNADGTVDELELEGDVLDAQNLALQLSSEGNCVTVEAAAPEDEEEEAGEEEAEAAGADPEAEATEEIESP